MDSPDASDEDLVKESLAAGNREAFGRIVARYQTLVCSIAYSGTGSLSLSEDLAQETFLAAWKQLGHLREPHKLRPWLCGIVRNLTSDLLRKQGREPSHAAEPLDSIHESPGPELQPHDLTISREEQAILWRSLEGIPEIYREPLVLFYREQQSIEAVAQSLELSSDAVKQRLSRGRKLLQEQVLAFVEGALARTSPGRTFTLAVVASLPMATFSAKAATIGATAAKGSATAKTAGAMGLLAVIPSSLVVILQNYLGYRIGLASARSDEERSHVKTLFRRVGLITLGLFLPLAVVVLWHFWNDNSHLYVFGLLAIGLVLIYVPTMLAFCISSKRNSGEYYAGVLAQEYGGILPKPSWEYRTITTLLGLPLVHVRIGDRFAVLRGPVRAWLAVGHHAIGGLFAFGCMAMAPLSIGWLSIGVFSLGGLSMGVFAVGGIAVGIWSLFGALAVGWDASGFVAVGWSMAKGHFTLAHDFALGRVARAVQANNDLATNFIDPSLFSRCARFITRHWLWLNLVWIFASLVQWWIVSRTSPAEKHKKETP